MRGKGTKICARSVRSSALLWVKRVMPDAITDDKEGNFHAQDVTVNCQAMDICR